MDRQELLHMFILDAIADDYESLETIQREVMTLGSRAGLTIDQPAIRRGVIDPIHSGLIRAYRLSPTRPAEELHGVPSFEDFGPLHFRLTDAGRTNQLSECADWPFDETGKLRNGWSLRND